MMNVKQAEIKLIAALEDIKQTNQGDNETLHYDSDDALAQFLFDIGALDAADKYDELSKYFWYA